MEDNEYQEVAKTCMELIAYDNGCVSRDEPMTFPATHLKNITHTASEFFAANEDVLTDADLEEICDGEISEVQKAYGHREGFKNFYGSLNRYFLYLCNKV